MGMSARLFKKQLNLMQVIVRIGSKIFGEQKLNYFNFSIFIY